MEAWASGRTRTVWSRLASGYSFSSRPARVFSVDSARSTETPGARRPIISNICQLRLSMYRRRGESCWYIEIGNQRSGPLKVLVPLNPAGPTPTTVKAAPLRISLLPMIPGSPPKRESQKAWARKTTGLPPRAAKSSGPKVRPSSGLMPSTSK